MEGWWIVFARRARARQIFGAEGLTIWSKLTAFSSHILKNKIHSFLTPTKMNPILEFLIRDRTNFGGRMRILNVGVDEAY